MRSVGEWASKVPDRYDHHPRLVPYLLSGLVIYFNIIKGLFDEYEEIAKVAFEAIEECGIDLEKERVNLIILI